MTSNSVAVGRCWPIRPAAPASAIYIDIDIATFVEAKLGLLRAHMSQVLKNGLVDLEALEAQARYRGFRARIRNAEAFETERFLWELPLSTVITPPADALTGRA